MPDSLLISPCDSKSAGETVGSLVKGYVENTSCIGEHKRLIEAQKEYKHRVETEYGKSE